jgi:hypothetical protein
LIRFAALCSLQTSNYDQKQIVEELPMRTGLVAKMALVIPILLTFSAGPVWSGCLTPPISAEAINKFKSDPQALVAPDADARTVEAQVRDLAGSDASLAADLVRVAKGAIPRLQTAIAAGLAQAAIACSNVDQQAALLIQQAVASFDDGQFQASFAAVAGDLSTAATAAATAFATGSVGSVVITNPNVSPGTTTSFSGGGSMAFFQIAAPGFNVNTTINNNNNKPTTGATTAADPVSATR